MHVVVSLGTGRLPVKAVDVCDVYRPEGVMDIAKVVFGAKNLAELFVDQVLTLSFAELPTFRNEYGVIFPLSLFVLFLLAFPPSLSLLFPPLCGFWVVMLP